MVDDRVRFESDEAAEHRSSLNHVMATLSDILSVLSHNSSKDLTVTIVSAIKSQL